MNAPDEQSAKAEQNLPALNYESPPRGVGRAAIAGVILACFALLGMLTDYLLFWSTIPHRDEIQITGFCVSVAGAVGSLIAVRFASARRSGDRLCRIIVVTLLGLTLFVLLLMQ
jgi:hypothetical protein